MNSTRGSVLLAILLQLAAAHVGAIEAVVQPRDGQHTWIDRPWDVRYFLKVEHALYWTATRWKAAERNGRPGRIFFDVDEILKAETVVNATPNDDGPQAFVLLAIEFDSTGAVQSGTTLSGLRGRLNRLQYLVLAAGDEPAAKTYNLAHWFTGSGDASAHWAPAYCNGEQRPDAAMVRSPMYLYGSLFKADEYSTTFGCREWASQLYDPARPYIDVTSYVPVARSTSYESFIRPFIGWARAGDKKPVIGKHESAWYCLHDCPGDDRPGVILDISRWAAANGWKTPKPPTKVPTFPDPPTVPGFYPQ